MSLFELYLSQADNCASETEYHNDHNDFWVDEGHLAYGVSSHCDNHGDYDSSSK